MASSEVQSTSSEPIWSVCLASGALASLAAAMEREIYTTERTTDDESIELDRCETSDQDDSTPGRRHPVGFRRHPAPD